MYAVPVVLLRAVAKQELCKKEDLPGSLFILWVWISITIRFFACAKHNTKSCHMLVTSPGEIKR